MSTSETSAAPECVPGTSIYRGATVRCPATGEQGVVQGWSLGQRADGALAYIVGVCCSYAGGDSSVAYYASAWEVVEPASADVSPTCGSDGAPCVDCTPDEPPAELRPLIDAFAAAWDERAESLARVARAMAPEPSVEQLPAGARVRVTFGPDVGCVGTVISGPDPSGYYSVTIDGRPADNWGGLWFYLGHEVALTTTPPTESRPWANDAAYAAEGARIG